MSPATIDKPNPQAEAEILAADAIGDIIEHWGFRKGLGRVWTVLFISGEALPAAEIGDRLSMSAGAVSMTLTELQRWGVVHRVWRPGERREFFEVQRLLSFVIVAETALDSFIKSRRVDFTRFGDLVRFPIRALGRRKAD
jgi:DNA-binding transcriptional regulator GbsR (MarR family)